MITKTAGRSINILLVEDNPGDIRLFRENISEVYDTSYMISHAGRLSETLRTLDESSPDVVILDLTLPDSDGYNTFINVRMHAPNVPIILLTSIVDEDLAVRALQNGAQDYLIKGQVDSAQLHRSIRFAIQRNQAMQREHRLAYFDVLTGLPNRQLFTDRLSQALTRAQRYGEQAALMFIDLDGFKQINDTLGHDCGDRLLQQTAERLQKCLRKSDTVARIGGDEFTCILPNIANTEDVSVVARKIIKALAETFELQGGLQANISGSIGISIYPDDTKSPEDLLKAADIAMYYAKNQGKNNFRFFSE
ncbi:MAG: GGDEF domain-containing response regulator [Nitrospira sp.]|nr:GGDEF domain-containing response regulator [bacterium]MBL7050133.1 GGDEF domain-containing response regulator [Nitrospira sp.]